MIDTPTVSLVGDVMIETRLSELGCDRDGGFQAAIAALAESTCVIGNLEMPLSRRGYRVPKHSNLRSDPEVIDDVRAMGIDAVSLANNHMMDYGQPALFDTLAACDGAGVLRCGAGADLEEALCPAWLEVGGIRLGLLSVACTLPVESDAGPGKPGIAPLRVGFSFEVDPSLLVEQPGTMPVVRSWTLQEDRDLICERIAGMKREADVALVAIHWGVPSYWLSPYQGLLAEYQQPLGHALVDAGADIICGHHSHSLHPIEMYRDRPIFYSLGNFLFEGARGFMEPESIIVRVALGHQPSFELIPLMLDDRGIPHRAFDAEAEMVLQKLASLSAPYGTEIEVSGDRGNIRQPAMSHHS